MAIQQTTVGQHSEYESAGIRNNNIPAVERMVRPPTVVYKQIRIGMPPSLLDVVQTEGDSFLVQAIGLSDKPFISITTLTVCNG